MFILNSDRPENSYEEWQGAWDRYAAYLASIRDALPAAACDFAIAPWHYDFTDHRAPHDAWLEHILVREVGTGERLEDRSLSAIVRLLGAYHDGYIELTYSDVTPLALSPSQTDRGFGDWLYDEVRLSNAGRVLHEIEWSRGSRWLIECSDIRYLWCPDAEPANAPGPAHSA